MPIGGPIASGPIAGAPSQPSGPSATATATTSATATLAGAGALAGESDATTSNTGVLMGVGSLAGLASATTSTTASVGGAGALAGEAGATTSASANPVAGALAGTASATTSASGTLTGGSATVVSGQFSYGGSPELQSTRRRKRKATAAEQARQADAAAAVARSATIQVADGSEAVEPEPSIPDAIVARREVAAGTSEISIAASSYASAAVDNPARERADRARHDAIRTVRIRRDATARVHRQQLHAKLAAPRGAESRFAGDIVQTFGALHRHVEGIVLAHLSGADSARTDASKPKQPVSKSARIAAVGGLAGASLQRDVQHHIQTGAAPAYVRMAAAVNKATADQAKLIGITPKSAGIEDFVAQSREASLGFLEDAGRDYVDDVRGVLTDEDNFGLSAGDLADLISGRAGVSMSKANLIARTSTLQLHAGISQRRQQAAGVDRYTWSTSADERVRPQHRARDGQVFAYDDPPDEDDYDGPPGAPPNCRCVALPILDEGEGESEGGEGEGGEDDEPDEAVA